MNFDLVRVNVLRLCNDLLKRLSRSIDTQFCGRILVFLANFFPLNEKSGLNIVGQFNTDNVTRYEQRPPPLSTTNNGTVTNGDQQQLVDITMDVVDILEEGEMKDT
jgi:THO complex subunit 1